MFLLESYLDAREAAGQPEAAAELESAIDTLAQSVGPNDPRLVKLRKRASAPN